MKLSLNTTSFYGKTHDFFVDNGFFEKTGKNTFDAVKTEESFGGLYVVVNLRCFCSKKHKKDES